MRRKIVFLLLLSTFLTVHTSKVLGRDGSLNIDVHDYSLEEKKEKSYISQDKELYKLFDPSIEKKVNTIKEKESMSYKEIKDFNFLVDSKKEDLVSDYKNELFIYDELAIDPEKIGVTLKEKKEGPNILVIILVGLAFLIMFISVAGSIRRKRELLEWETMTI